MEEFQRKLASQTVKRRDLVLGGGIICCFSHGVSLFFSFDHLRQTPHVTWQWKGKGFLQNPFKKQNNFLIVYFLSCHGFGGAIFTILHISLLTRLAVCRRGVDCLALNW